jgi:hypothetical protein
MKHPLLATLALLTACAGAGTGGDPGADTGGAGAGGSGSAAIDVDRSGGGGGGAGVGGTTTTIGGTMTAGMGGVNGGGGANASSGTGASAGGAATGGMGGMGGMLAPTPGGGGGSPSVAAGAATYPNAAALPELCAKYCTCMGGGKCKGNLPADCMNTCMQKGTTWHLSCRIDKCMVAQTDYQDQIIGDCLAAIGVNACFNMGE